MKRSYSLCIAFALLAGVSTATDKAKPAKTVFHVSGLECGGCVYSVQSTLSQTPGVSEAEVIQGFEGTATVSYDPAVISEHQIAQAVRESPMVHGTPYLAAMKLRIRGYAQDGNASKVKALFDRWNQWVELKVTNEREGEVLVHFLPLENSAQVKTRRGWSLAQLTEALEAPAPKGLGLKFEVLPLGAP